MWLESTGVQTEKRETKPKKGKQSPERALYVERDTRPCKELHSLIEKLLFWVHIDTADWQYQLKRGAFIMVESVLTISNFWPVGYTGVSEHGLTDLGTRLLDTLSDDPELPLKSKTKKNGLSRHCLWGDKIRLFRQQIRLLASAAKVHRCVCLFTVRNWTAENMPGMKWTGQLNWGNLSAFDCSGG